MVVGAGRQSRGAHLGRVPAVRARGYDTKEEVEAQQRPGGRANHVEEDLREHEPAREHAADGRVACRRRGVQLPREGIASACGRLGGLCREIDLNVDVWCRGLFCVPRYRRRQACWWTGAPRRRQTRRSLGRPRLTRLSARSWKAYALPGKERKKEPAARERQNVPGATRGEREVGTPPPSPGIKKERNKTDKPNEGWEEDKVPTCTSRIL